MTDTILKLIDSRYRLNEIDCGDFSSMKVSGMSFSIRAFKAEGLGHVSVMQATGFFGLMKMDTLIINPTEVDLPLYSYDRILAMGQDTLIVELYDTVVGSFAEDALLRVKEAFSNLPARDPGEHWYDSIKLDSSISLKGKAKAFSDKFNQLASAHLKAYVFTPEASSVQNRAQKLDKASYYVSGLIEKGGPSTDVFKKSIGEEKTRELFENILFGTK